MDVRVIDLNADLGEGHGPWRMTDDEALLEIVTSANVACGAHAGDAATMRRVCERAAERGVAIGAHVAYRDLAGFGRRNMDVDPHDLASDVALQIGALEVFARAAGTRVSYVKPHGALYNRVAYDDDQALAVLEGVAIAARAMGAALPVLSLPGARIAAHATEHAPAVVEGFADRAYDSPGTLRPRSEPGAVLHAPAEIAAQAVLLASSAEPPASICVHGDSPAAVEAARAVRAALDEAGHLLRAFAPAP